MANELDELKGPIHSDGHEINVIHKQIPVEIGIGSLLFEITLWLAGIIPGIVFLVMKMKARTYLNQLQQRIQANASEIDNYLEQRVVILSNVVPLLEKAIETDRDIMKSVAILRGGANNYPDLRRNEKSQSLDGMFSQIALAFEAYPNLKSHDAIADAMRQNSYLMKEITAARTLYNDSVSLWNQEIFAWPTKQIVAARLGYTTRVPFTTSREVKAISKGTFF